MLLLAGLGAVLALAVIFAWPTKPAGPYWVSVGRIEDFTPGSVRTFREHRFHLVRLEDGEFLALYRKDPHLGCTVPFRPDSEFMGRRGWFRNPCHGETYDLRGFCYAGPCPRGLDRFPVRVDAGEVRVLVPGRSRQAQAYFEERLLIHGPPADFSGKYGEPVNPPER